MDIAVQNVRPILKILGSIISKRCGLRILLYLSESAFSVIK